MNGRDALIKSSKSNSKSNDTEKRRKDVGTASNSTDFIKQISQMPTSTQTANTPIKKPKEALHPFYEPNKTARVSDEVKSKVKVLSAFIQSKEGVEHDTMNDFINVMADFYIANALTEDERTTYQQIFDVTTSAKRK